VDVVLDGGNAGSFSVAPVAGGVAEDDGVGAGGCVVVTCGGIAVRGVMLGAGGVAMEGVFEAGLFGGGGAGVGFAGTSPGCNKVR
jgi:hypothetical protein